MANFDSIEQTLEATNLAVGLHPALQSLYRQAKVIQSRMALYQAGTNQPYNAAINTLYTPAQRAELAEILALVNSLVAALELDHANALRI